MSATVNSLVDMFGIEQQDSTNEPAAWSLAGVANLTIKIVGLWLYDPFHRLHRLDHHWLS
jgi:hypothetical protein